MNRVQVGGAGGWGYNRKLHHLGVYTQEYGELEKLSSLPQLLELSVISNPVSG